MKPRSIITGLIHLICGSEDPRCGMRDIITHRQSYKKHFVFCLLSFVFCLFLFPFSVSAAPDDTLYMRMKNIIELESHADEAALSIQRFAAGVFHDLPLDTTDSADATVPFLIQKEEYVDYSLQILMGLMCGDDDLKNSYGTCLLAQNRIKNIIERNAWLRKLGRELQVIATGYEMGTDGYPSKPVDVIGRFSSIAHLWRASNDAFVDPIPEKVTKTRPWPSSFAASIESTAEDIVERLTDMILTWDGIEDPPTEKKDEDDMVGAVWRYRHGVQYVIDHEGSCSNTPADNPANVWIERRWCDLENDLLNLRALIQADPVDTSDGVKILYPSFIDKEENIYIWMRSDDVGLQWNIPIEPLQAALYHPDYSECFESKTPKECFDDHTDTIVRGGSYPSKLGDLEKEDQPYLGLDASAQEAAATGGSRSDDLADHAVVLEPEEGEGICSHPLHQRGYLCRRVEYEACDVTDEQQDALSNASISGIILTRCQPERFKYDVAQKSASVNICGIGGWREEVAANLVEDTEFLQPDMRPNACSACAIDVHCKPECVDGKPNVAHTEYIKRNGVTEICIPEEPDGVGQAFYLLAHELTHAQQNCNDSDLAVGKRIGLRDERRNEPERCCPVEREAYFVQCKLMAMDGILEAAGVTIDQCASAFANFSCSDLDPDPDDDDYICTNDGIDPIDVANAINFGRTQVFPDPDDGPPSTCKDALKSPRIKALRNSIPLVCRPGCQSEYKNTIGNNLCYTGQCLEETREWARDVPGRMGLTTVDEDFPWDSCERPDPNLGAFAAPPAITPPRFPLYRPELLLKQMDNALCQINGLPALTPPVLCGFNETKRLGLPPLTLIQSVEDLSLQTEEYEKSGQGIQYAASAIGARIATDMLTQYLAASSRQFTDLLNTMYHVFTQVEELEFPSTMCPRIADDGLSCQDLINN